MNRLSINFAWTALNLAGRALLLSLCVTAIGCAVNPVTGENELSLVSVSQEIAIGEQQYGPSQQSQGGLYYLDPGLQSYVADVGMKLAKVSHQPDLPYEFVVINSAIPNAWALPGGKIAVNRGLLTELEDEAQLAAVLGHEIVHAAARHSAAQMTRGTLVGLSAQLATIAAANYGYGDLGNLASQVGGAAIMAKYGRDDELESDDYGMQYMARAGYNPEAAVDLQETFVRLSKNREQDFISGLFASHPPSSERVEANRQRAAQMPGGERFRERYQQRIAQLKRDAPAYEAQEKAMSALEDKNADAALKYLDTAVKLQPEEAQFWEMRGHAWAMKKSEQQAEKAYSTATRKNPDLFSPWLYRGVTRYRQGELSGARDDLASSYRLLPTATSAYYLGDIFLQLGGEDEAAKYLKQAMRSKDRELAMAAYNKLALIELDEAPHKYIASQPFVGKGGYLFIAVKNTTSFPVKAVRVELVDMSSADTARRSQVITRGFSLAPEQQIEFSTGIGPFQDPRSAQRFRTRVVVARHAK
ncbi:M48 family metalloprotease [Pseudohalioglobus lutimaris]|uniref:Peptidase M48 n=1 Tax=Pseudohalioglobus lutimaris TaxID=1737061 RepID=A0A2N5X558_9GAMM|nr:M48 family metalloprotease [Pseudohalioglobus lutimaris]PLW69619.1 peptidase M48 [Pseudohalioglobus lutimaris]